MDYYNFLGETDLITSLPEGSLGLGPYLSSWFYCELYLSSRNALFLRRKFPQIFEIAILGGDFVELYSGDFYRLGLLEESWKKDWPLLYY